MTTGGQENQAPIKNPVLGKITQGEKPITPSLKPTGDTTAYSPAEVDKIATSPPIIKNYFSNFLTAFYVGERSLKAIVEYKPTDKINTVFSVVSVMGPIISFLNPVAGVYMEFTINYASLLYNYSKRPFTINDLAGVIVPGSYLAHKKVGIVAEVLYNFSKTKDVLTSCIPLVKFINSDLASALKILANFNKTADMAKEVISKFSSTSSTLANEGSQLSGDMGDSTSSKHFSDHLYQFIIF